VVSLHAGVEYEPRPSARQRALVRAAADAGADLVLGHHPHVLEGVARLPRPGRRPMLAIYSLGNLVFDPVRPEAKDGALLEVSLDAGGVTAARVVPVVLEAGQTQLAPPARARAIVSRLAALSAELGTAIAADGEVAIGH
jgi:poly-gamma-glutamate synthesis protein (capsule biosynthesis protein)